jgi:hypothetical protein
VGLVAETNPELESTEQRRGHAQPTLAPGDAVLQSAVDIIIWLEILQKRRFHTERSNDCQRKNDSQNICNPCFKRQYYQEQ